MFLVLIFIVAVIMYRVLISIPLFENKDLRARAATIASMSAAVVNLICIMTLGRVYEKLAVKLTDWGMIYNTNIIFLYANYPKAHRILLRSELLGLTLTMYYHHTK